MAEKLMLAVVDKPGPIVTLTDGSPFPFRGVVEVDLGEILLKLQIGVESGRPVLNRAVVDRRTRRQICGPDGSVAMTGEDGPPLTSASIQFAVSEEVLNAAIEALASIAAHQDTGDPNGAGTATRPTRNYRLNTDDLMREIAAVALSDPEHPNQAVCRAFNYGPRQASRLIGLATERGFLDHRLLAPTKNRARANE